MASCNVAAAASAAAAVVKEVTPSTSSEKTIDGSHVPRLTPPVNLLRQLKEIQPWANDEYVLQKAREKFGMFTATRLNGVARLQGCNDEDFVWVNQSFGVLVCLKHMVVHRCGETWQRLRCWLDLGDDGSSLYCRRIRIGGSNEPSWCCAFSRKRLPDSDTLQMTVSPVQNLSDLAAMVYGTGMQSRNEIAHSSVLIGGTMGRQKHSFDDNSCLGMKRHNLLKQCIDAMVKGLVDPDKRAKYNNIIKRRVGNFQSLHNKQFTPGVQLLLRSRLLDLCTHLLRELKVDNKDMNSLVFFALVMILDGPQLGPDIVAPRLCLRWLVPLPVETLFEAAFGLCLSQYSKTVTKIQRVTGNPRFAHDAGWCLASRGPATKCVESKSSPFS